MIALVIVLTINMISVKLFGEMEFWAALIKVVAWVTFLVIGIVFLAGRFTIEGQAIQGFDGCNEFSGRLDQPGSIGSTRRGCPEHALRLPLDMSDPMPRLRSGNIENGTLTLPADARFSRASFKKTP